jgi:aspartyl-tRNA(Asn)/glutamyl-tRNA(Gln) amidotransferase subunit A
LQVGSRHPHMVGQLEAVLERAACDAAVQISLSLSIAFLSCNRQKVRLEGEVKIVLRKARHGHRNTVAVIGLLGGAEESSIALVQRLFDVNVFGVARVINAVLPIMRKQKSGRIVNMSSILGLIPSPFNAFREATAGHRDDELYKMAKTMLSLPDTSMADYIDAEQAAERLRDGYADYFSRYDALITHVLPIPAHKHGVEEFVIDGQTVDATYLQGATVPLNVTGLPGISMRFGTSAEGMPINVQIVGAWQAETTILHIASILEGVSPTRGMRPQL